MAAITRFLFEGGRGKLASRGESSLLEKGGGGIDAV